MSAPGATSYQNPVHRGDFPDPSVVRVGADDFYAVTTSTEWAPYFPVFHSRDLVTWERCASVFSERPAWAAGQFWAPEISVRDGTYFVYYTARRRYGPLTIAVATAPHPCGPWTDHGPLVGQAAGSIDATTAMQDGRPWLIWKEDGNATGHPTTLWTQELADDGRSLLGERYAMLRNDAPWEDRVVEAPSVIERDGWFYAFFSGNKCCGESCRYAVGVARARSLTGPWEKCPQNPIMSANEAFRGPGHGSVTTTADGRTWYLYHAYRNAPGATRVGRELMLDEIRWNNGWPSINRGRGPSRRALRPAPSGIHRRGAGFAADLHAPLDATWQWEQDRRCTAVIETGPGRLVQHVAEAASDARDRLAAVIAQPARSLDYTAKATLDAGSLDRRVIASLAAFGDRRNALGVGVRDGVVYSWRRRRGRTTEQIIGTTGGAREIHLRLDAIWGKAFRVSYSLDGRDWSDHADVLDGTHLPPWDRGVRIALAAGGKAGGVARWCAFRIDAITSVVTVLRPARATNRRAATGTYR